MGVLQRFERKLEGVVGNAFARLFKGKVHPAEIGRALRREADEQKVVVGEGRVLIPNRYTVFLGEADYGHLSEWEHQLTATLAEMVQEYSTGEGWSTFGTVLVSFECDQALRTGVFEVRSKVDPDAAPRRAAPVHPAPNGSVRPTSPPPPAPRSTATAHVLVVDGPNTRVVLEEGDNIVGRGLDARVKLPDTGVSRRHLDVTVTGPMATASDLGSTNGTIVNGQRVSRQQLRDGDVIRIGHSVLVYRREQQ
ncbi:DUF3662 and FHA domain-containing protein [soil metagenome]